ncbi:hypothetical protein N4P33_15785 [Streptomyces sp. 15-116A]|uniref:hypothetical protein n=1 Tax=Streptomyces sp. 15-116A TaxID=2259035 RepID=UPI0021B45593|nr:hypothetical protein [Streptomyces sp. 15-116A]MCT7353623.1 hypothetical protein [Streptomyces sp. 15-116A]
MLKTLAQLNAERRATFPSFVGRQALLGVAAAPRIRLHEENSTVRLNSAASDGKL